VRYPSGVKIFIVVAKSRPELFEYFKAGLAGVRDVEVMIDRRIGPPAPPPPPHLADSERRTALNIYDELNVRGFVIVRLPG
jgi:hypothetical protein